MSLMWWNRTSRKVLEERLKHAEDRIAQQQRYHHIYVATLIVAQRELANAHAALRRKGKALKILHRRIQANKECT